MSKRIFVRCDDICPTMDFKRFTQAVEIFEKYDIKPLLGIVPMCEDSELQIDAPNERFWDYMHELKKRGYVLAMHGYRHVYDSNTRGKVNLGFKSEFAGHSLEAQIEKIGRGKEILKSHGIETDIFFAPAHSYDDNTIRALAINGFKYMSDGWSLEPYKRHGIICLPCRTGGIPKIKDGGYYTVVLHAHEWNYPEKADAYDRFNVLCKKYSTDFVDFSEYTDRKCGIYGVQRIIEIVVVFWRRQLFPIIRKIYHKIRKK